LPAVDSAERASVIAAIWRADCAAQHDSNGPAHRAA
jgi:hypothetical protein